MDHYCLNVVSKENLLFKISAIFQEESLNLTLCEADRAWKKIVLKADLTAQAERHETSFQDYFKNLKKYLESPSKDAQLVLENGEFIINLLLDNSMKILFFKTKLTEANFSNSVHDLIDSLYKSNKEILKELQALKQEHTSVKSECDILKKKMDEFLERKNFEEDKLYSNFIAIICEKKRQIQHLNEYLIAFRQGRSTLNPPVPFKRKKMSQKVLKVVEPEKSSEGSSSEEENYSTDDGTSVQTQKISDLFTKPSTSKINDNVILIGSPDSPPLIFPKRLHIEDPQNKDHFVRNREVGIRVVSIDNLMPSKVSKKNNISKEEFSTQDLLDDL
ncbi:DNA repair protein XRCC4-like [Euwallacea fornicatus]|uniref:DNA repair protein XRCC4-like n=1 Tax=Euwallacea fornicatus TaxID=995702 RepID=UPI00338F2F03